MMVLKRKDWAEIYNALDTKLLALKRGAYGPELERRQDAKWIAHLEAIKRKLGPDGERAARTGVAHWRG
jgi:hypothetical protein